MYVCMYIYIYIGDLSGEAQSSDDHGGRGRGRHAGSGRMLYYTYVDVYICIVCVYMYVCMYTYIYIYIYVCMHACMHVCMYVCMYVCLRVCDSGMRSFNLSSWRSASKMKPVPRRSFMVLCPPGCRTDSDATRLATRLLERAVIGLLLRLPRGHSRGFGPVLSGWS